MTEERLALNYLTNRTSVKLNEPVSFNCDNLLVACSVLSNAIKALEIAKKVFEYNSLSSHQITEACEEGLITEEEKNHLFKYVRKGRYDR